MVTPVVATDFPKEHRYLIFNPEYPAIWFEVNSVDDEFAAVDEVLATRPPEWERIIELIDKQIEMRR